MFALNLLLALSNVVALLPLYLVHQQHDLITLHCVMFVSSMSFISHLLENHKHAMTGINGISSSVSYWFNRLDVLGCIIMTLRLTYMYLVTNGFQVHEYLMNPEIWLLILNSFVVLRLSEYDQLNSEIRTQYVVTHIVWHINAYVMTYFLLLNTVYYV